MGQWALFFNSGGCWGPDGLHTMNHLWRQLGFHPFCHCPVGSVAKIHLARNLWPFYMKTMWVVSLYIWLCRRVSFHSSYASNSQESGFSNTLFWTCHVLENAHSDCKCFWTLKTNVETKILFLVWQDPSIRIDPSVPEATLALLFFSVVAAFARDLTRNQTRLHGKAQLLNECRMEATFFSTQ